MGYAKTISEKIGSWEVIRLYDVKDGKMVLAKWGIKGWWSINEQLTLYNTWKEVLDHMNKN